MAPLIPTDEGHAAFIFPGIPEYFQLKFFYLWIFLSNLSDSYSYFTIVLLVCGILLNIFNLVILTRKSMRAYSTNVIMFGLSTSDAFILAMTIKGNIQQINQPTLISDECMEPPTYFLAVLDYILIILEGLARRCSPWLVILMATIRAVAITTAFSNNFGFLQASKTGWFAILFALVFSGFFVVFHVEALDVVPVGESSVVWVPPEHCVGFPPNFSMIGYNTVSINEETWSRYDQIQQAFSKVIPCILFPILTAILVIQLMKTEKFRKKNMKNGDGSRKKDRTNKLVIFTTVCFMFAELPPGLMRLIPYYIHDDFPGYLLIILALMKRWIIVSYINSSIHTILCYIMPSQYRKEVRNLFGIREQRSPPIFTNVPSNAQTKR